jgi:hypothetical protein
MSEIATARTRISELVHSAMVFRLLLPNISNTLGGYLLPPPSKIKYPTPSLAPLPSPW